MSLTFTGTFEQLKEKLSTIPGKWNESQPLKKVFRHDEGLLNWFQTTGTVQFQGKKGAQLEAQVKSLLYPELFRTPEALIVTPITGEAVQDKQEFRYEPADPTSYAHLIGETYDSELIFGIVNAVGTDSSRVVNPLKDRLRNYGYTAIEVKVSDLLPKPPQGSTEYDRTKHLIGAGDQLRRDSKKGWILAAGVAETIRALRPASGKRAYVVNSLKHPQEVDFLRRLYGDGFYLLGIHAERMRRTKFLVDNRNCTDLQANELIEIDEDENVDYGQKTRDTFHLSDFFLNLGNNDDYVNNTIERFLEIVFAHPYRNPTFNEFAMFMAFCSSIRSADLSRQVGAIIAKNHQIIASGANDCPSFGGGLYWSSIGPSGNVVEVPEGKDAEREVDSNRLEQRDIMAGISKKIAEIKGIEPEMLKSIDEVLGGSRIKDLTEFGRVVHAEMEALLSCARAGIEPVGATLYCTTFPCHNCTKHLIAAGIKRVVYVEPYPKSKALDFHSDSIFMNASLSDVPEGKVSFEPFIGVGARRFLDLFSMALGSGSKLVRKDRQGNTFVWKRETAKLRVPLLPNSYIEVEQEAASAFRAHFKKTFSP